MFLSCALPCCNGHLSNGNSQLLCICNLLPSLTGVRHTAGMRPRTTLMLKLYFPDPELLLRLLRWGTYPNSVLINCSTAVHFTGSRASAAELACVPERSRCCCSCCCNCWNLGACATSMLTTRESGQSIRSQASIVQLACVPEQFALPLQLLRWALYHTSADNLWVGHSQFTCSQLMAATPHQC